MNASSQGSLAKGMMIGLIMMVGSSAIMAESMAQKDDKARKNPENNWAAKIAGAATAAGVVAVTAGKMDEAQKPIVVIPVSPEEYATYKGFYHFRGTFELETGYGQVPQATIGVNHLSARYRLPLEFAIHYDYKRDMYSDASANSHNTYTLEWYTAPVLNFETKTGGQIGAYAGVRGDQIDGGSKASYFTYGLMYNFYQIDQYSLHAAGNATVTRWSDYTVDYTANVAGRYYFGPAFVEVGTTLDITDLNNLRTEFTGQIGIRF